MFLARDLWHSTSGQSLCSPSICFVKFLFRKFIRSVYVLVLLFRYIVSVFNYLDPHSLKKKTFLSSLCHKVFTVLCLSLKPFPWHFVLLH